MRFSVKTVQCIALAAAFLGLSTGAHAEQEGEMPAMTPEMQAEMAAWMELAEPGAHHEHLAPFVGTWKGVAEMWMAPDTPPIVSETLAVASWIMGGRYLQWKQTGDFAGTPFEGMAIEGYNNGEDRYEAVWIDNFGTLILFYTGSCSDDGASRDMATQFADPFAGGTVDYRTEYRWIDGNHFTFSTFMDKGDGEFKNMIITYERR